MYSAQSFIYKYRELPIVYLHWFSLQELFKCIKRIIQQCRFHFSELVKIIKFFYLQGQEFVHSNTHSIFLEFLSTGFIFIYSCD
jgi:hypothetical protein